MSDGHAFPAEAGDPYLLADSDAAQMLRNAPWTRFAGVGDSAAEGVTEPVAGYATRTWFDRVAAQLRMVRPDLTDLNLGRRNLVTAQVRDTQLAPALDFGPDLAVVVCGGNDLLQKVFDVDATKAEIELIVSAFLERGTTVVTMGLFDNTNSGHVAEKYRKVMSERLGLLGDTVRKMAGELGTIHVDLPAHPARDEAIFATDGLHLNARGQAVVAAEVVRQLGAHLSGQAA